MMIIGIDLGTTNSLAAFYKDDTPHLIPNALGEYMTPSVVGIDDGGEILVGKIAKERLLTHPTLTASVFKRNMGTKKAFTLGDKTFLPEELSAIIIKRLKEDAETFLNQPITEAVVSVPAYFSDAQRRATKTAGELAGLKIERIVNEPTCAALAYGLHEKEDYTKFLVFDLGGGTFDVSILEKYKNVMEVRAVAGDNFLGGEDFTQVLITHFAQKHDLDLAVLTPQETAALRKVAETAKIELTENSKATMQFIIEDEEFTTTITQTQYEKYCEPIFTALRHPIKRALSDANLRLTDIGNVLLVGGATKMPIIRSFVGKLLGRFPASYINQDEVVALGAAVHAALKARDESLTEIVLTDVCPYTLGTEIAIQKPNGLYEAGHYAPIIERNSIVPVSIVKRLYTLNDNQSAITSSILQGESRKAADNIKLGEITVNVPPAPAGKESIDIRFTYDINGILEADVKVVSTGAGDKLVIENSPGTLTPEELAQKLAAMQELKIHPREKEEYRYLLAWGERLYEESRGDRRTYLEEILRQYDDILDNQDDRMLRDFSQELKEILTDIEQDF
ncbi:MAG: molecular chaperone HscC [Defluviitaleaceae bacterium]|nr:molecular chaperone HscC [Defluviitaleaceae bacterium]